jgi:hypothetical protein
VELIPFTRFIHNQGVILDVGNGFCIVHGTNALKASSKDELATFRTSGIDGFLFSTSRRLTPKK